MRKISAMTQFLTSTQVVPTDWHMIRNPDPSEIQVTWVGHSTVVVQMEGITILTDPVFSERCSPSQFVGTKRYRPVPFRLDELPKVDAVCISHNHYDHLDYRSVKAIGNSAMWFVPLGLKRWFVEMNITNVIELDWWEEASFSSGGNTITFAATPAQHWSGRLPPFDHNDSLWCSWYGLFS